MAKIPLLSTVYKSKTIIGLSIIVSFLAVKTVAQQPGNANSGNNANPTSEQDTLDIAPDTAAPGAGQLPTDPSTTTAAPTNNEDVEERRPAPPSEPRFPSQPKVNNDPGRPIQIPVVGGEPIPDDQAFDTEDQIMADGLINQNDIVDEESREEDEFARRMMELNEEVLNREHYPVFIYEDRDRRDPFMPILQSRQSYLERSGGPSGLLQYDLSQLSLKAIAWNSKEPKALFRDPKSNIYMVKKKDLIGRNNGYIEDIREGEVIVIESRAVKGGQKFYSTQILRVGR